MDTKELLERLKDYGADTAGALERFVDDDELYCDCLIDFMGDNNFDLLKNSIHEGDYEQAFHAAHTIKGVLGNLGLTPFYLCTCELVESLRAKEYANLDAQYSNVVIQYEVLEKILRT